MNDNVIAFPKQNPRLPDLKQFKSQVNKARKNGSIKAAHAQEAADLFMTLMIEHLAVAGFNVSDDKHLKDMAFLIETLKSYILKYYGQYHHLQPLAEEIFLIGTDDQSEKGIILMKTDLLQEFVALAERIENDELQLDG